MLSPPHTVAVCCTNGAQASSEAITIRCIGNPSEILLPILVGQVLASRPLYLQTKGSLPMAVFTGLRTSRLLLSLALALACVVAAPLAAQKKQAPATRAPQKPRAASSEMPAVQANRPGRRAPGAQDQEDFSRRGQAGDRRPDRENGPRVPREHRLRRGLSFDGDLRGLPQTRPVRAERPEREGPEPNPTQVQTDRSAAVEEPAAPLPGPRSE